MAHKTLVGGTAYNISGGKSMVSGTAYNIKGGKTLVGGTGYNVSFGPNVSAVLNDNDWSTISTVSLSGQAANYWSVGDTKEIIINGTVGNTTFDNLHIFAFIIGFDHNSNVEGHNTIHFQIGKSAQNDGINLCFADSKNNSSTSSAGYFNMNYSRSNSGGWESSKMRTVLLGSSYTPSSPLSGSLMAALPNDLLGVMRCVTKYSDNTGGGSNTSSCVTATADYLWLLSEFEVFGAITNSNNAERNYQQQYTYYADGNQEKICYIYNDTSSKALWWLRSVLANGTSHFCCVLAGYAAGTRYSHWSFGVYPSFCV